jgi:DNA-binding IclR family transcriptional regulator
LSTNFCWCSIYCIISKGESNSSMSSFKSLERAIDILFSFSKSHYNQSPSEIATEVGIPITSVYRFLSTFEKKGLVEKDKSTGKYSLGYDLLILESAVRKKIGLEKITRPSLNTLANETNETVQVTILNKNHGFLLFSEESPTPPRFVPEYGYPMPLYAGCTVQVIMAHLPMEQQELILAGGLEKIGPKSILVPDELRNRLAEIRRNGFAVSYEEYYPGSKGIAVPLFKRGAEIFGSLAVSAPIERFDSEKEANVLEMLQKEAEVINTLLSQ